MKKISMNGKIIRMFRQLFKRPKIIIPFSVLTVLISITCLIGLWFFYKHWYPPMLVLTPEDVGNGALIETNYGNIEVVFNRNVNFPASQFTRLARSGFYDGTRIHRIVPDLLIEGGDPLTRFTELKPLWGQGGSTSVFKNETHMDDNMIEGTFALTGSSVGTYGSHFFILTKNTPWMKGQHTILGTVVKGLDVVRHIAGIQTDTVNFPLEDIIIYKITII